VHSKKLSRRRFVKSAAALAGAWAAGGKQLQADSVATAAGRPNIVYLFADQQHSQAMGSIDPFFDTPHLDRLASEAALFERAFCTTPQCSPSRSSMLTGLYPSKTGVMGNVGAAGGNPLATKTIGAMLQETGYHTVYHGKWHLGSDPTGRAGWSEVGGKRKDEATTQDAVRFLQSPKATQGPFALFASYVDPHDIYHFRPDRDKAPEGVELPESWRRATFDDRPKIHKEFMTRDQGRLMRGADEDAWQAYHAFYRDKVRLYDRGVGQVLATLKAAGLWENTIVIVSSDHGDMDTHHRLIFKGPFMYDQMIRVPMIVRVPQAFGGSLRGRVRDFDTVNVDLVPTIRDFAGLDQIECDGLSLKPILCGEANPPRRDYVIAQYYSKQQWVNPIRTIRTAEHKYNHYIDHGEELYDLTNDPHEIVNLANDPKHARTKRELRAELDQWIETNNDPFYSLTTTKLKKGFEWRREPRPKPKPS